MLFKTGKFFLYMLPHYEWPNYQVSHTIIKKATIITSQLKWTKKDNRSKLKQKWTFKVHEDAVLSAPGLALADDDSWHDLFPQIGLSFLDSGHDHVADAGRRKSVESPFDSFHRYYVEILRTRVVGTVHRRRHRQTQRHPELVPRRPSPSSLRHCCSLLSSVVLLEIKKYRVYICVFDRLCVRVFERRLSGVWIQGLSYSCTKAGNIWNDVVLLLITELNCFKKKKKKVNLNAPLQISSQNN